MASRERPARAISRRLSYVLRHRPDSIGVTLDAGGWVDVERRFHHPTAFVLHRAGSEPERFVRPQVGGGYFHELVEVTECLRSGRTESEVMPLEDSLAVQRILNDACEQLGVHHEEDASVEV